MDSQGPNAAVKTVVKILRKATRLVQIVPFAYLCVYVIYMLFGYFMSEQILCLVDSIFTVTPITTGGLLIGSHLFKLCGWHKTACLIPVSSHIEGCVDSYIITFTQNEVLTINVTIGLFSLAFVVLAFKHFAYGK
jgi:hypothetical protein